MKDQATQERFLELRTQGWTFERIARELDVSKSTLINWSRKFRFVIQNQRAIQLEALQQELLASAETRARALAEKLREIESELQKRDCSELTTAQLFRLAASLRRQILQETGELQFTSPLAEIPDDEYHEQAQTWKP